MSKSETSLSLSNSSGISSSQSSSQSIIIKPITKPKFITDVSRELENLKRFLQETKEIRLELDLEWASIFDGSESENAEELQETYPHPKLLIRRTYVSDSKKSFKKFMLCRASNPIYFKILDCNLKSLFTVEDATSPSCPFLQKKTMVINDLKGGTLVNLKQTLLGYDITDHEGNLQLRISKFKCYGWCANHGYGIKFRITNAAGNEVAQIHKTWEGSFLECLTDCRTFRISFSDHEISWECKLGILSVIYPLVS